MVEFTQRILFENKKSNHLKMICFYQDDSAGLAEGKTTNSYIYYNRVKLFLNKILL